MTHASRRIALRIYLVSVAQVAVTTLAIVLVGFFAFEARTERDARREAQHVVLELSALLDQPRALELAVQRIKHTLGAELTLYASDGSLLASNVNPPASVISDHAAAPDPGPIADEGVATAASAIVVAATPTPPSTRR